jgi:hypothetical protein
MSNPVRYPNGVTDNKITHPMGLLPVLDPTKHVVFHDDFVAVTTAAAGITGWHEDAVNAGTSLAPADGHGGIAKVVIDNADGDNHNYQWAINATPIEMFKLEAGKEAWLRVRLKNEDDDQNIIQAGLHVAADDVLGTEPTDMFYFRNNRATPTALEFAVGKTASTEVTIALGALGDDTWNVLTAYYDGKNTVSAWREVAGVVVASGSVSVTSSTAGDLLPDTEMTVGFGMEALDTGADDFHIDFITVVTAR